MDETRKDIPSGGSSKWEMGQNLVLSGVNLPAGSEDDAWEVVGWAHAGKAWFKIWGWILRVVRGVTWSGLHF